MVEDAKMATTATLETVRSIVLRGSAPGRYPIRLDTQSRGNNYWSKLGATILVRYEAILTVCKQALIESVDLTHQKRVVCCTVQSSH
jgi:hypothetical protein